MLKGNFNEFKHGSLGAIKLGKSLDNGPTHLDICLMSSCRCNEVFYGKNQSFGSEVL